MYTVLNAFRIRNSNINWIKVIHKSLHVNSKYMCNSQSKGNTDSKLPLSFRALTLSVLAPTSHRSFSRELRTDDRFRRPPDEDDEEEVSFRMGSCRTILNPQHRLGITFSLNSFVVRVYRRGFIALFIGMTKIISQAYVS